MATLVKDRRDVAVSPLNGLSVFVAEDEPLVLMLLTDMLDELGCNVVGSATRVDQAIQLVAGKAVDVAILDVNLGDQNVEPLVAVLSARSVPVVIATGFAAQDMAKRFPRSVLLAKPYSMHSLQQALLTTLQRSQAEPLS